jgi:nucleotide-binding universal stress UspA family protein
MEAGYRHIVVGTDGSDSASEAVRHAARLAAVFDSELTVVTAFAADTGATARAREEAPEEVRWAINDAADAEERARAGRKIALDAGAEHVHTTVQPGDPAEVVIEAAELRRADVIVVGSKGMTSAKRFLIGSVPNRISHHAPCDVIIVRTAP